MLIIKYFGMIAETIGKTEEELCLVENLTILTTELELKYPQIKVLNYKFAVNQTMETENVRLTDNDEVALLPPFAGG